MLDLLGGQRVEGRGMRWGSGRREDRDFLGGGEDD